MHDNSAAGGRAGARALYGADRWPPAARRRRAARDIMRVVLAPRVST